MAGPRVFISSTSELRYVRAYVCEYVASLGWEAIDYSSGNMPYPPNIDPADACVVEVASSHLLVLLIGRRYGSNASEQIDPADRSFVSNQTTFHSVCKREYIMARSSGIHDYVFVESEVDFEYRNLVRDPTFRCPPSSPVEQNVVYFLQELNDQVNPKPRIFKFTDQSEITAVLANQFAELMRVYLAEKRQALLTHRSASGATK